MRVAPDGTVFAEYADLARLLGLSLRSVQRLGQEGVLKSPSVKARKAEFELFGSVSGYLAWLRAKYEKERGKKSREELELQKLEADVALKTVQAELAQFKSDVQSGKLIAVEAVRADYAAFLAEMNRFLEGLGKSVVAAVSGILDDAQERRLERDLRAQVYAKTRSFILKSVGEGDGQPNV
jgi:phage terminase Nu1 subunit (DNA packaging protein)